MKVLVTGSSGLIGSELVTFFDPRAQMIIGIDNNMRADFFGQEGDTTWNRDRLLATTRHFHHHHLDVRDPAGLQELITQQGSYDHIVHSAAQTTHDLAARRPTDDFDVKAVGT